MGTGGSQNVRSLRAPVILALSALGICLAILARHAISDDAHITMRIVRHAIEGEGLRYNIGDSSVQPATSPLNLVLMLLLSLLLSVLGIRTEQAVLLSPTVIASFALPAFGVGAYMLMAGDRPVSVPAAMAAAFSMCVPISLSTMGLETLLSMALCFAAIILYRYRKFAAMGWVLGLAFLARHDAVLLAGILFYLIWRESKTEGGKPINAAAAFLAVVAPWVVFSLIYYGVATPTTLESKAAQGGTNYWPAWFPTMLPHWLDVYFLKSPALRIGFVLLATGGLLGAIWKRTRASMCVLVFVLYQFLVFASYSIMKMPDYHWYFVPYAIAVVIAAGWWVSMLDRTQYRPFLSAIAVVGVVAVFAVMYNSLPTAGSVWASYKEAGRYLETHPPKTAAGLMEIGIIGFYAPSVRVFDFAGVATLDQAARVSQNAAHTWLENPSVADVVVIRGVKHPLEPDFDPVFYSLYDHEWTGTPSDAFPNGLQVWRLKQ
jgi:hypothetical protein